MLMLQVGPHCSKMLGHAEMHRNVFADLYSILFLGVGSLTFSSLTFILWEMGITVPALQLARFKHTQSDLCGARYSKCLVNGHSLHVAHWLQNNSAGPGRRRMW